MNMVKAYIYWKGILNRLKMPLLAKPGLQLPLTFILAALLIFADNFPAEALSFAVDSLSDIVNTATDGSCNTINGCTLREAITEIEAGSDVSNTIDFDPSLSGTILLQNDLPQITKNLSIDGPGSDVITVDGGGQWWIFYSASQDLTIQGLALRGGYAYYGGAIYVGANQSAIITGVVFSGNTASSSGGGAIYASQNSHVEISRCRFSDNGAAYSGGAVATQGDILIDQTLFVNNTAGSGAGGALNVGGSAPTVDIARSVFENNGTSGGGGGAIAAILGDSGLFNIVNSSIIGNTATGGGGGISLRGPGGRVIIREVTISNNAAGEYGGGINVTNTPPSFVVVNTTIGGNRAGIGGGGIYNGSLPLQLSNVTINGNVADADADGAGNGGGIYGVSSFILENTVVAGNFDLNPGGSLPDCSGTITSRGYNLIGDFTGCAGIGPEDKFLLDPLLDALAWNGGYTRTRLPIYDGSSGSPLVEAGNPSGCTYDDNGDGNSTGPLDTDQRGLTRPYDADGLDGARCDIGAVELNHCDNGISDDDEDDIDCGGSLCAACSCHDTHIASIDGTTYAALQGAYDATWDGARIKAREEDTGEILTFDRPAYITLIGGHDCDFFRMRGMTTVAGLTVSAGRLTVENLAISGP